MGLSDGKCDRCRKESGCLTMSYFNTQMICLDCEDRERKHPRFKEAQEIETEMVRRGNYNYGGVGKPSDL